MASDLIIENKEARNNLTAEEIPHPRVSFYSIYAKRFWDIVLCSFALLILSPLLLTVSILGLCFHGRPIFYESIRPGKDCQPIKIYKFRTMTNDTDESGNLLPENLRITKFGKLLRRTSIDELPELFSIIRGDMSIVGPRPLLSSYVKLYSARHIMRQNVRPGLACTRVYKKGEIKPSSHTWRQQFENDIYYIEHISFLLDVQMIFAIAKAALMGSDRRSDDTRVPFNGYNLDDTRTKQEALMDNLWRQNDNINIRTASGR